MRQHSIVFILFIACICPCFGNIEYATKDYRGTKKIRAGFMGLRDISLLPKMNEVGLNTAIVVFRNLQAPTDSKSQSLLLEWTSAASSAGIDLMPCVNYWHAESDWHKPLYNFVSDGDELLDTPCPLDPATYKALIHDRFVNLAKLSEKMPIKGVLLDTEMYGANLITFGVLCNCDGCWKRFSLAHHVPYLNKGERISYLKSSGKMALYKKFAIDYLASMARQTDYEIRRIAPDFIVGITRLDQFNPFTDGLAKGFGSGENPVLAFSLKTYSVGYTPYIDQAKNRLKEISANVEFAPGIWQERFKTTALPAQYYNCAKNTAGYWVYQIVDLNPGYKNNWSGNERSSYWNAISVANAELDKLAMDSSYQTSLKIVSNATLLSKVQKKILRTPNLTSVASYISPDFPSNTLQLLKRNKLVFNASKGDLIRFKFKFNKRHGAKTNYGRAMLLTKSGEILDHVELNYSHVGVLSANAKYDGTYSIVLNTDFNPTTVVGLTHPFSIEASHDCQSHLLKPTVPLYLSVKDNRQAAKLYFLVDGPGEAVTVTFKTTTGKTFASYDIKSRIVIDLPLHELDNNQVISMHVEPMPGVYFEDLIFNVESGLSNYYSFSKAGLLK